ncbi:MAG: ABC transporter permease, partial [Actinomycetota bacterium]
MPPEVTLLAAQSPVQRADSTAALEAGLDALQTVAPADSARRGRVRRAVVPPLVALALALGAWQAYVELGSHPRSVVPAPADV